MEVALTSLAILKVEWDIGHDYIESFLPFVLETLNNNPQPQISLPELQESINDDFRILIPQGALKTILQRAVRKGYVERKEGVYQIKFERLRNINLARVRSDVLRKQESLINKLLEFVSENHSIEWEKEESEQALLSFLRGQSIPILAAAVEGETIKFNKQTASSVNYIVSSFICELHKNDPDGFEFLTTVVKGSMLANVLFFPEIGQVEKRFVDAEIFFDTSVILRTMGLATSGEQIACREMIDLLYELNATIRCFDHTVREVQGVLHAASNALSNPDLLRQSRGEALEYFVATGSTPSDVELMIARLRQHLLNFHCHVVQRPSYENKLTVNETKFQHILQEEVGYAREGTLQHDLDALTSIFRLRQGRFPQSIENCEAIFITDNTALVRASLRFFREEFGDASTIVPICLPDHIISTLAWLKRPLRSPNLPDKLLIADCYAALNPPNKLWKLYLEEIDRLSTVGVISGDDYHLLRFSSEARALLMDETLGDHTAFGEGTVQEVLERAKASIRSEAEELLFAEKRRRLHVEEEAHKFRFSVEHRIRTLSSRLAFIISRSLLIIGIIVQVVVAILAFPGVKDIKSSLIRSGLSFVMILTSISTIINSTFGTSLMSIIRRLENFTSKSFKRFIARFFAGISSFD